MCLYINKKKKAGCGLGMRLGDIVLYKELYITSVCHYIEEGLLSGIPLYIPNIYSLSLACMDVLKDNKILYMLISICRPKLTCNLYCMK